MDSRHWSLGSITWAEFIARCQPGSLGTEKEHQPYLMGTLAPTSVMHKRAKDPCFDIHRRKDAVHSRSMLLLDVDHPEPDFLDALEMLVPWAALVHTTWSSAPDALRWRLAIPLDREATPEEYIAATQAVMGLLGPDQFDRSTDQPERYMFSPAAENPGWFRHHVLTGPAAPVDELLSGYQRDLSGKPIPEPKRARKDPFELEGVMGAFNRAYEDIDLLIEAYELPYTRVDEDRYQLNGALSEAGMGPVPNAPGLWWSHHSTDPAANRACSAFDLVRLHRYGWMDEDQDPRTPVNRLPSHAEMLDLATQDTRVIAQLAGVEFSDQMEEQVKGTAWRAQLSYDSKGKPRAIVQNWDLIRDNDPVFLSLSFNEMSFQPEFLRDVPWRSVTKGSRTVTLSDRWEIVYYLEREYNGFQPTKQAVDAAIDTTVHRRVVNPVRDWLEGLEWDGVPRVETCLPGVEVTDYTRMVARKCLTAAAARMLEPGIKWDHTLVLFGDEGLGKTFWVQLLTRGYTSTLGGVSNKDTLITMQRKWIMLADEGHSIRKADADQMKEFLTRTEDTFRLPYEREVISHPRRAVIWSTINDEVFLREQQGNRRFLVVHCTGKADLDLVKDDHYVEQVWAEAVHLFRGGEQLWLEDEEGAVAAVVREKHIEESALDGLIREYLDTPVPAGWWDMHLDERLQWRQDRGQGFVPEGTERLDAVCSLQIWVEAMGRRMGDHTRNDLLLITQALAKLTGWDRGKKLSRLPGYGPQRVVRRAIDPSELL